MRTTLLALLLVACGGPPEIPGEAPKAPQVQVLVDNQSWDRVVVYVVTTPTSGHVVGECPAVRKCVLRLPPAMVGFVYSTGWLRMAYRPADGEPRVLYYIGEIQMPTDHVVARISNVHGRAYLSAGA